MKFGNHLCVSGNILIKCLEGLTRPPWISLTTQHNKGWDTIDDDHRYAFANMVVAWRKYSWHQYSQAGSLQKKIRQFGSTWRKFLWSCFYKLRNLVSAASPFGVKLNHTSWKVFVEAYGEAMNIFAVFPCLKIEINLALMRIK